MDNERKELEAVDELATRLKISQRGVRRLVAARRIPYYRVGGQLRFVPAEVLDALRSEVRSA